MTVKAIKLAGMLGVIGLLPACAGGYNVPESNQDAPEVQEITPFVPLGADDIMARIGELPAQALAEKECGLFLWLKREDTPLVFFQRAGGEAVMALDGPDANLTRSAFDIPIAFQFFKEQQFSYADMKVTLSIEPEELRTLQKGRKIPSGKIAISTEEGWGASLPVAGVIACK